LPVAKAQAARCVLDMENKNDKPEPTEYEKYYVPESSKLAIFATIGLILSIFGASSIMNDMTFGEPGESTNSWSIFLFGFIFLCRHALLPGFRIAIRENIAGMNSRPAEEVLRAGYVLVHLLRSHVFLRILWCIVLYPIPGWTLVSG